MDFWSLMRQILHDVLLVLIDKLNFPRQQTISGVCVFCLQCMHSINFNQMMQNVSLNIRLPYSTEH